MQTRQLGELTLPRLVVGTMAYGSARSTRQQADTVRAAIDAGMTAIDTAPLYHFGRTEAMLAEVLRDRPTASVLSKVGVRWGDDARGEVMLRTNVAGVPVTARKDSRPISVRRDVEDSLRRLGCERIDGCQIHHPDVHTPIEDTVGELLRLRDEGKVGAIGVSNMSADQVDATQRALGGIPLSSHQLEYSLLVPQGRGALAHAGARGIGTLVYSPLHRGALTGGVVRRSRLQRGDPRRGRGPFVYANARRIDAAIDRAVAPIAEHQQCSIACIVLAWLLHQVHVDAVIVGVSSPGQAAETAQAANTKLSADEVHRITRSFAGLTLDPHARPPVHVRVEDRARRVAGAVLRRARRVAARWL